MKYLAIILSVYMTVLSLLPCRDGADVIASVTHSVVQKSRECNSQSSQESCPPFCTCNCCSNARYITSLPVTSTFELTIAKDYPVASIPSIQDQPINIWQPPQLG